MDPAILNVTFTKLIVLKWPSLVTFGKFNCTDKFSTGIFLPCFSTGKMPAVGWPCPASPFFFLPSFCQVFLSSLKVAFFPRTQALKTMNRFYCWPQRRLGSKTKLFSCTMQRVQPAHCMWTVHFSIALLLYFLMEQSSHLGGGAVRHETLEMFTENVF